MQELARDTRAIPGALIGVLLLVAVGARPLAAAEGTEVRFASADGGEIYGLLYGDGDHAVVLAHGMVFDKESWAPLAPRLAAAGLQVLAIDFRGYGKSTAGSEGEKLFLDIVGAMSYLRRRGADRISIVGASMGGGAAARTAVVVEPEEIDRLVLLAPAAISNPEQMHAGRFVYISAEGDPSMDRTRDQYARAPEPKRLEILPGEAHAQHLFKTEQSDALVALIVEVLTD